MWTDDPEKMGIYVIRVKVTNVVWNSITLAAPVNPVWTFTVTVGLPDPWVEVAPDIAD